MDIRRTLAVTALALAVGFGAGRMVPGLSVHAQTTSPKPTEPRASQDEFDSHVIHQTDLPETTLVPGSTSRLIAGEESMISFLTMKKNSYFAPHHHVQEQIMIVLDGSCDEIIEGKLYHVSKGDVIILPPNIVHGAYIGPDDVHVIDVFGEVRSDYMIKELQQMIKMNKDSGHKY